MDNLIWVKRLFNAAAWSLGRLHVQGPAALEMIKNLAGKMSIKSVPPYCVKPVIIENNCTAVIRGLQNNAPDKSIIASVVRAPCEKAKEILKEESNS